MTDLHSLLVHEAPLAIVALSSDGTILFWNKTAEAIFGFTSTESADQSIHTLIVPDQYQEQSRQANEVAIQNGRVIYESIRRRKNGSDLPVEISLTRQTYDGQTILISTIRPLPAPKSSQETTAFLANMSHDFRTPLNCIIGFTEFLLEHNSGSLNEKQKEYLADVLNSGKQLLNMINAVLEVAKIDSGKISIVPQEFEVSIVLQQVLSIFSPVAESKGVQLRTQLSEDCGVVTLDLHKFKQALYTLFSNAIKLCEPGDRIETVLKKSDDENLEIVITRIGSQAGSVEGLDLLLAKKILELQNGSLTTENAFDLGTSFIVKLPNKYPVSA